MSTIQDLIKAETVQIEPDVTPVTPVTASTEIPKDDTSKIEPLAAEENVATFNIPQFGQETPTEPLKENKETKVVQDWRDVIKSVDTKELLKAAGLDDKDIEFVEFRKSGNDPLKYIEAKFFDWDKINDLDVIRNEYKKQFPTFEPNQIERLISKKYGFIEDGEESDNEDALLMVKADAHLARQKNKDEQTKFQIPKYERQQNETDIEKLKLEAEQIEAQDYQKLKSFYDNHEATKTLINSKRVAIKLGDKGAFNFNIDKPESIMQMLMDGETWQKVVANPQGEPDVAKLQEIALHAANPNYNMDLVNYGISLGKKMMVEEGQNARRPIGQQPSGVGEKGLVIKGTGTLKQHLSGN